MKKIIEIVAAITKKTEKFLEDNLDVENMWDSLTRVEIILTIEDEFNILFEQEEVAQITTLKKLINIVESKE